MAKKDPKMTIEDLSEKIDRSIESLAVSITKEFNRVNDRFDLSDQRLDQLENKFGLFQTEIRSNFDRLWHEINKIDQRLTAIEKRTGEDTDLALSEIEKLKKRISILEKQLKTKSI